jgi:phosphorylase kinase alpha/beta subunit
MSKRRPLRPVPAAADAAAARRARLDALGQQARAIILERQDPDTGLLPASTAVTVHGDYTHAWVRDNVYSILAVWALGLAWRRVDAAAAAPLEAAVVKLMRGLLAAMMRQAHKVERFKITQAPLDALHAKYDTARGEPVVGDTEWGHLQLDATAVYVLLLAQMSAAGLRIVQRPSEVAFVQNLAYYLSKAWRTPDFGIWERGHKRNQGRAELNASSVGMAKAALEAIDGFEPLPGLAPPVLSAADDIAHARDALQALLPRESESKETDAALLSIVGYPAFAVDDPALAQRTRDTVLGKLQGRYGCKRFLRDGHQTVLEDASRLHYEPGELQQFEHIESEWPLFFTYLLVDAALRGASEEAADWRARLESLMQERDGQQLLPELYYVPAAAVAAERERPHSQPREPNANVPLVWAQSLYLVGVLLQEGLVEPGDIDPLGRRYSRVAASLPCVQVCLLAEDELVRSRLTALGIAAQTVASLLPVQVRDAVQLAAVYAELGRDATLGLTGRPAQPLGSLATSLVFERGRELSLCLPAFGRQRGFYLALDNRLLAEEIDYEIVYLRRHWRRDGQPLLCLLLTAPMLDAPGADALQASLVTLAAGDAAAVRVGPLEALLPQATRRRIDGLAAWPAAAAEVPAGAAAPAVLRWEEAATRPLTAERAAALAVTADEAGLLLQLERSRNPYEQIELLAILWRRAGPMCDTGFGGDVLQLTEAVYARACRERRWGVLRRAAGLLDIHDDALEEAVAEIVARGMRVTLGRSYDAGAVVARPLAQAELLARLRAHGGDDGRGRVLIEEIVLLLGMLVRADGALFSGMLTLRPWQAVLLVTGWLAREHGVNQAEAYDHLLDLSPHAILGRLREVIANAQDMAANLARVQTLHAVGGGGTLARVEFPAANDPVLTPEHGGWPGWRELTGVIAGLPQDFHERVWELLQRCAGVVIGDQLDSGNALVSAVAGADTTPGERGFALQVEELLNRIQAPEYRQLTIEALQALSEVARANPGLKIGELLVLDVLIGTAVKLGWADAGGAEAGYDEQVPQAWQAFYASPPHRVANLVAAALAFLLVVPPEAAEPAEPAAPDGPAERAGQVDPAEHADPAATGAVAAAADAAPPVA